MNDVNKEGDVGALGSHLISSLLRSLQDTLDTPHTWPEDSTCPPWVVTTWVMCNVSSENMIFSHFLRSNYIEFSQRSRPSHITLAYFVAQE